MTGDSDVRASARAIIPVGMWGHMNAAGLPARTVAALHSGHWAYTRRYGWMWVSAEPFGWATYRYGRWAYSADIGWYWVPGYRRAPARVSWRRSDSYVA